MSFLAKLFGKTKTLNEPMRGLELPQSQDQIDNTRATMEAEMVADKERRVKAAEQKPVNE